MGLFVKRPKSPVHSDETERKLKCLFAVSTTDKAEMYRFYQERVETLRSRLWTMLAWLAGVQGALLVFAVKELHFGVSGANYVTMDQPLLVLVISVFGMALSFAMLNIIDDGTSHIEVNWRRADLSAWQRKCAQYRG